jgi:uncharacterized membrane protein YciS (DUF1049 family)
MGTLSGAGELVGPILATLLILFAIALAVAWIVLPFALIGTKRHLRELIAETKRTNTLLEAMSRSRTRNDAAPELDAIRPER